MTLGIFKNGIYSIMDMMKTSTYTVIPIHQRPDLFIDCCKLINSEWPSSETRRLRTLSKSCENFPTCLVLLNEEKVVGHCKVSLVPNLNDSCFIESVVIDYGCRSQGLGSLLMRGTEEYVTNKGITTIYLSTKGQENFYTKNGYRYCDPINIWDCRSISAPIAAIRNNFMKAGPCPGPPPPPMPKFSFITPSRAKTTKTYMVKQL